MDPRAAACRPASGRGRFRVRAKSCRKMRKPFRKYIPGPGVGGPTPGSSSGPIGEDRMNPRLQQVLAELESDSGADVGETFTTLVAGYFASTRSGVGRVSTAHAPAEL